MPSRDVAAVHAGHQQRSAKVEDYINAPLKTRQTVLQCNATATNIVCHFCTLSTNATRLGRKYKNPGRLILTPTV